MDQAAYLTARTAAADSLIGCWVAYCTQPDERLARDFAILQLRLELAAQHALESNYAAAVDVLPPLPLSFNAISAQWLSPN